MCRVGSRCASRRPSTAFTAATAERLDEAALSSCRVPSFPSHCVAAAAPAACSLIVAPAREQRAQRRAVRARGAGQDAVNTWLDLASFVSSAGSSGHTPYDELADKIGAGGGWGCAGCEAAGCAAAALLNRRPQTGAPRPPWCCAGRDVYIDVAGWHLVCIYPPQPCSASSSCQTCEVSCSRAQLRASAAAVHPPPPTPPRLSTPAVPERHQGVAGAVHGAGSGRAAGPQDPGAGEGRRMKLLAPCLRPRLRSPRGAHGAPPA